MAKTINGTKSLKTRTPDVTIRKAVGNNVTKIRCPCGQLAHPRPDGKGGQILSCTCGKTFSSRAM